MSNEKFFGLSHLDLARFNIKRYLEHLNTPPKPSDSLPSSSIGYTPIVSTPSKEHRALDLGHALLDDKEFLQLLPEIKPLTLVTELNLENNELTGTSIQALLEAFPNIKKLNLSRNRLHINEGCYYVGQFKHLSYVDVSANCLKSEDLEKLQKSNSLLDVSFGNNERVDIVRRARLIGACEYNTKVTIQKGVGVSTMDCTKDDYIAKNLTEFVKRIKHGEKISQIIADYRPDFSFLQNHSQRLVK